MAEREQIDAVLDVEGAPLYSAFTFIQREIARIQQSVRDIGKDSYKNANDFGKALQAQTKELQNALGQMRTLTGPGTAFGDYDKALKSARDQSKAFFQNQENDRKQSLARQVETERQAAKEFSDIDQATEAKRIESAKLRSAAVLEAGRAEIAANARLITSRNELTAAQEANAAALNKYRNAAKTATDPEQQRALATLITLEKNRATALDQTERAINRNVSANEKASLAAERASNRINSQNAKMWADYDKQNNKPKSFTLSNDEKAGMEIVGGINRSVVLNEAQQLQSLRTLRTAAARDQVAENKAVAASRLETARADAVSAARELQTTQEVTAAKQRSIEMIQRLRSAQNDSSISQEQRAAAAQLLLIEKDRNAELERRGRLLAQQKATADTRLAGTDLKAQLALASTDVRAQVAGGTASGIVLAQEQANKEARILELKEAQRGVDFQLRENALNNLRVAEARVVAAERLVRADQQEVASQEKSALAASRAQAIQERSSLGGRASTAIKNTALYGVVAGAGFGAFNAIQQTVSDVIQLEDEFAKLQAISDSTDKQMTGLKTTIFQIGDNSRFAVNDLVKIAQTLAQAGVSGQQMESVLRSVTTLATASGSTPDEAVQLVTAALGSFQLQASEAARVADLMTSALNRTKLTVGQVAQAIQYVGATAYEQNISLETLLATVGAVAQGGVRSGSTIGTGFRQFLVDLQTPTKNLKFELDRLGITQADVDVKTRGLASVFQTLKDKGFGATAAYAGLETRSAAFYLVAKNNVDVMQDLQLSFALQGASAAANERAMNSLTAQWTRFKNILEEGFADSMQEPMIILQNLLTALSDRILQIRQNAENLKAANANGTASAADTDLSPYISGFIKGGLNLTGNLLNRTAGNGSLSDAFNISKGWGTDLDNWGKKAGEASAATEQYATEIKNASDKVTQHQDAITGVDKEMDRLKLQQGSLINNQKQSQIETVNLTSRFGGLVKYLGTTKNAYLDLIQAMSRYRGEESSFIAQAYGEQADAQLRQNNLDKTGLSSTISKIRNNSQLMGSGATSLTPAEKAMLGNTGSTNFAETMRQAANRIEKSNNELALVLRDAATYGSRLQVGQSSAARDIAQAGQAKAAATPFGQSIVTGTAGYQARLEGLGTLSLADRTKAGGNLSTAIRGSIGNLEGKLKNFDGTADGREFLKTAIGNLRNLLDQVAAAIKPNQEEVKKAKTDAADAARAEREAAKRPKVQQGDVDGILKGFGLTFGRGNDSSPAAKAVEDALHARGLTRATGDTSAHTITGGIARDVSLKGISDDRAKELVELIKAQLKEQGIDALVQFETGKGKNQGTARHIHVGVRPGTRFSKDRTSEAEARYDNSVNDAEVAVNQQDLKLALKDIETDSSDVAIERAKKAMAAVNDSLLKQARGTLVQEGVDPDGPKGKARLAQVQETINNNLEELQNKISASIIKSVQFQLKEIDRAFDRAVAPAKNYQALVDAQVSGFGYESNKNKIPDYVVADAQHRAALAKENTDRATLSALPGKISGLEDQKAGLLGLANQTPEIKAQIDTLTQSITELNTQRDALAQALSAGGLVPSTISDGLALAVQQFREANDLTKSFKDTIITNLGGAINQVSSGLTDMFTSIFTGSKTALGAFGDFAKGIGNYLAQLAAKFVASQILNALFSLAGIGGSALAGGGGGGNSFQYNGSFGSSAPPVTFAFNGGQMGDPPGMIRRAGGGIVANGDDRQDSVHAKLAKGEWVVRKAAVDSVGNQFMANLNNQGANALKNQGTAIQPVNILPKQEMAVYVVAPEQKPSLSKDDVLVTFTDDVLKGGEMKKLIKYVAQGG